MNKQDILIRLLKEGHISDEEFKFLYGPFNSAGSFSDYDIDVWVGSQRTDKNGFPAHDEKKISDPRICDPLGYPIK